MIGSLTRALASQRVAGAKDVRRIGHCTAPAGRASAGTKLDTERVFPPKAVPVVRLQRRRRVLKTPSTHRQRSPSLPPAISAVARESPNLPLRNSHETSLHRRRSGSDPRARQHVRNAADDPHARRFRPLQQLALADEVFIAQAVFYGLCWIDWNGRQAVLFHIVERKFYIFGMVFWPQDAIYLAVLLVISAYALFLFTAIAGRLFCGYACPQTVYTEIFMWLERKIEGERSAGIKLDRQPLSARKLRLKATKHASGCCSRCGPGPPSSATSRRSGK